MCPLARGLSYFRPKVDLSCTFLMQILTDYDLSKTQGVWLTVLAEPSGKGTAVSCIAIRFLHLQTLMGFQIEF